ncbi:MAG: hypothetical protein U5Q44_16500 [Dehalococcoidia bacterium]|nr:hypothetical protein [Dehalococcoidia bacterium]
MRLELTGEFPPPPGMVRVLEEGSRDDITAGARVALPAEDGAPAASAEAAIVLLPAD